MGSQRVRFDCEVPAVPVDGQRGRRHYGFVGAVAVSWLAAEGLLDSGPKPKPEPKSEPEPKLKPKIFLLEAL